ncbi:MAG: glycoside hydrolase family 3 N-terminal domain-containing protein, partial [Termitinemataceae bacterium]
PENRPFLDNRSFAADPALAAAAAAAFIQGMEAAGIACVAKHFPASAAADPHDGPSVLDVSRERLQFLMTPFAVLGSQTRTNGSLASIAEGAANGGGAARSGSLGGASITASSGGHDGASIAAAGGNGAHGGTGIMASSGKGSGGFSAANNVNAANNVSAAGFGVPAVMVAHTMVPAIDPDRPASLSFRFISEWLKQDYEFPGIVIADDFSMAAIRRAGWNYDNAIIEAFLAGIDMVMVWPKDLVRVHRLLSKRATQDPHFKARLQDATARIIMQKYLSGLILFKGVEPQSASTSEDIESASRAFTNIGTETLDPKTFDPETFACMRRGTEQYLQEKNLR